MGIKAGKKPGETHYSSLKIRPPHIKGDRRVSCRGKRVSQLQQHQTHQSQRAGVRPQKIPARITWMSACPLVSSRMRASHSSPLSHHPQDTLEVCLRAKKQDRGSRLEDLGKSLSILGKKNKTSSLLSKG